MLEAKKIAGKPRRLYTAVWVVENFRCLVVSWQSSVIHIRSYVLWKVIRERAPMEGRARNFDTMVNFTIWRINLVVSTLGGLTFVKLNREGCMSSILGIWNLWTFSTVTFIQKIASCVPMPKPPCNRLFLCPSWIRSPNPSFPGLMKNALKVDV